MESARGGTGRVPSEKIDGIDRQKTGAAPRTVTERRVEMGEERGIRRRQMPGRGAPNLGNTN